VNYSSADSGLYNIEHCHHPTWQTKKHAADLTPYPAKLTPFEPVNGSDTQYSQLHKVIDPHPFKEASISGFLPPQPFKVPAKFLNLGNHTGFWWPTLSELNNMLMNFLGPATRNTASTLRMTRHFARMLCIGPPPEPPVLPIVPDQSTPSITSLAPLIILSPDNFFFVSHSIGGNH
jgi:hypothetical protein